MQAGRRYTFFQTANWTRKFILIFLVVGTIPVVIYELLNIKWLATVVPWQPISLVGIAVAFYLGFKNNSSYERLWEARKIWGGIVNASRTYTIMARDFVTNEHAKEPRSKEELWSIHKTLVHRHIAWLYALTYQLRMVKPWEHNDKNAQDFRKNFGTTYDISLFENLKPYLSAEEYSYIMTKGNKASHLISLQSKHLQKLKQAGLIEDFRHMELENMLKEFYELQGKSERIKNFPFPRQYASVNYFFVWIFIFLLPLAMLGIFANLEPSYLVWLCIPTTTLISWVFHTMEMIGDYSENPFEGLYNDVPITSMARGIEIDIRQMLEETDLPEPYTPQSAFQILY